MNLSKSALITLFVISISACGGGGGSDGDANTVANHLSDTEALFEGVWESCDSEDFGSSVESQNSELFRETLRRGNTTLLYIGYTGNDCSGEELYVEEYEGTYDVLNVVTADSGVEAIQVNWNNSQGGVFCYDLVYFEDDRIYFGDNNTGDCDTAETRPTDIYFDHFRTKVVE